MRMSTDDVPTVETGPDAEQGGASRGKRPAPLSQAPQNNQCSHRAYPKLQALAASEEMKKIPRLSSNTATRPEPGCNHKEVKPGGQLGAQCPRDKVRSEGVEARQCPRKHGQQRMSNSLRSNLMMRPYGTRGNRSANPGEQNPVNRPTATASRRAASGSSKP
jgi:hypothetical protein